MLIRSFLNLSCSSSGKDDDRSDETRLSSRRSPTNAIRRECERQVKERTMKRPRCVFLLRIRRVVRTRGRRLVDQPASQLASFVRSFVRRFLASLIVCRFV